MHRVALVANLTILYIMFIHYIEHHFRVNSWCLCLPSSWSLHEVLLKDFHLCDSCYLFEVGNVASSTLFIFQWVTDFFLCCRNYLSCCMLFYTPLLFLELLHIYSILSLLIVVQWDIERMEFCHFVLKGH